MVGSSDILCVVRPHGRLLAIECKSPKGRLTEAQHACLTAVARLGGYACVVRTVPEALAALQAARDEVPSPMLASANQHESKLLFLNTAIEHIAKRWSKLTRFINVPTLPLDNNAAERALRHVAVGRKNHYGSRSRRGAEVSAILYSLIETCEHLEVDACAYLKAAVQAHHEGRVLELPHIWKSVEKNYPFATNCPLARMLCVEQPVLVFGLRFRAQSHNAGLCQTVSCEDLRKSRACERKESIGKVRRAFVAEHVQSGQSLYAFAESRGVSRLQEFRVPSSTVLSFGLRIRDQTQGFDLRHLTFCEE